MRALLMINNTVLKEFIIDQDEIIIGRDADCDIQIDNIAVSREHARITKALENYFVEDMGSKNGTFVNGQKVLKKLIDTGDEITIGKYFLKIYFGDDSDVAKNAKINETYNTFRMGPNDFKKIFDRHNK
jgi:pSer/pThr/pTyr-binding forkhead associated (FHA) protein